MPNILDLPDELLLEIGNHFYGRARNRDLTSLSLVCQRFRAVAQEKLLCVPSFHIRYIDAYLWRLGHCSNLIPRIKRLEIFSSSKDRTTRVRTGLPHPFYWDVSYPAVSCRPELRFSENFIMKCKELIKFFAQGRLDYVFLWTKALEDDIAQALLGVLLCALPNLRELYLGASWLMDFPMFSKVVADQDEGWEPEDWGGNHDWMEVIIDILKTKLHSLEFPASFTDLQFFERSAVFDFRGFSQLRYISVPMDALQWYKGNQNGNPQIGPWLIFPPTLEMLRISNCNEFTPDFMELLFSQKQKTRFPRLQSIELYFKIYLRLVDKYFLEFVQEDCADAEVELSLYFPPDGHLHSDTQLQIRTPWSMIGEGYSLCRHPSCNCSKETVIFRWDALGDVIMNEDSSDMTYLLGSPLCDP